MKKTPIIYERQKRYQACNVTLRVRQRDGTTPAPFASLTVSEVFRVLWWEFERGVTSRTANFYGEVTVGLTRGRKYHFSLSWIGADARRRTLDIWRTLTAPSYSETVRFTW